MPNDHIAISTPANASRSHHLYTMEELHQVIANASDWKADFRHLPKINTAGLRFSAIPGCTPAGDDHLEKRLLMGVCQDDKKSPVYAYIIRKRTGPYNMVELRLNQAGVRKLNLCYMAKADESFTKVDFVRPFDRLEKKICSNAWRKELRSLVMFYFMEKGILEKIAFTADQLDMLRKACTSIAREAVRTSQKPGRAWPKVTKSTATQKEAETQALNIAGRDKAQTAMAIKQEPLVTHPEVEAPENDSTRAVTTMVLDHDDVATALLPSVYEEALNTSRRAVHPPSTHKQHDTAPVSELNRKRASEDNSIGLSKRQELDDIDKGEKLKREEVTL